MSRRTVSHRRLKKYNVGDMRERISLNLRNIQEPDFGSANFEQTFTEIVEVWAFVKTFDAVGSGQKIFDDVDIGSQPTHLFVIRYYPDLTSEEVIKWMDNNYEIVKIIDPEERHEYLELYSKLLGDENLEANQ